MIDLDNLEELAKAATPGEWTVCQHLKSIEADQACTCGYRGVVFGPDERGIPMAVCQPGHDPEPVGEEGLGPQNYPRPAQIANGQYIAAANPTAILKLIAEVQKLRAELNDFTTGYGDLNQEVIQLREDLQAAKLLAHANGEMFRAEKADNERMRLVLDVVRKHLMGWVSFEELHAALVKYETGPLQANTRPLATD